jgi:hypothetical protein
MQYAASNNIVVLMPSTDDNGVNILAKCWRIEADRPIKDDG